MGGAFLDTVRGGTVANALVPQTQIQSSVLGNFYFQLFLVLFLAVGGHRLFLQAIFDSYELLPPFGGGFVGEGLAAAFITASAQTFVLAAKLIAPALVVVMFLDVALGLANRLAPQFNVFFLSLPLKSAAALLVLGLSIYYSASVAQQAFEGHYEWLRETLRVLGAEGR
jgi:type III secretory pathway component EscT